MEQSNLSQWLTDHAINEWRHRLECVVQQQGAYCTHWSLFLNESIQFCVWHCLVFIHLFAEILRTIFVVQFFGPPGMSCRLRLLARTLYYTIIWRSLLSICRNWSVGPVIYQLRHCVVNDVISTKYCSLCTEAYSALEVARECAIQIYYLLTYLLKVLQKMTGFNFFTAWPFAPTAIFCYHSWWIKLYIICFQ